MTQHSFFSTKRQTCNSSSETQGRLWFCHLSCLFVGTLPTGIHLLKTSGCYKFQRNRLLFLLKQEVISIHIFFLPADHQNVIIQERFWESSTYSTRMISLLFQLLTVSIPLYLLLFTEQKEDCQLIHNWLSLLPTCSSVLIDCSGTPLSTREGFVRMKEMIQEGIKLFFAYLTICSAEIISCINS